MSTENLLQGIICIVITNEKAMQRMKVIEEAIGALQAIHRQVSIDKTICVDQGTNHVINMLRNSLSSHVPQQNSSSSASHGGFQTSEFSIYTIRIETSGTAASELIIEKSHQSPDPKRWTVTQRFTPLNATMSEDEWLNAQFVPQPSHHTIECESVLLQGPHLLEEGEWLISTHAHHKSTSIDFSLYCFTDSRRAGR